MSDRDDYIEVHERIQSFYEKFPDGSLQLYSNPALYHVGEKTFIAYTAAAYRTPDDLRPGIGCAWEPVPGPTPFTRDSELQNAETSAWGRAIAALGFETHNGIATGRDVEKAKAAAKPEPKAKEPAKLSEPQRKKIYAILGEFAKEGFAPPPPSADWKTHFVTHEFNGRAIEEFSKAQASKAIEIVQAALDEMRAEAIKAQQDAAAETPDDDIPF